MINLLTTELRSQQ